MREDNKDDPEEQIPLVFLLDQLQFCFQVLTGQKFYLHI